MRVLITGAAGFLGSWFLEYLMTDDHASHDVWSVDIRPHPGGIPIDVQDLETWLQDFDEQVDLVLHFAAPVGGRMKIEHDPMYNADAFRLDSVMFRWAVSHATTVVYPSSSAIYPVDLQGEASLRWDSLGQLREGFIDVRNQSFGLPDELYGFSKLAGEMMAWKAHEKHGLNVLCIRPFSGYGPGQSDDYPVPAILGRVIARQESQTLWGDGYQKRDFVYVTDIVQTTMARIEMGFGGFETMNICTGIGVDFRTILQLACDIEGIKADPIMSLDKPVGVRRRVGDPQRMNRFRNFRDFVPLRDGLANTMRWMRDPGPPQLGQEMAAEVTVEPVS